MLTKVLLSIKSKKIYEYLLTIQYTILHIIEKKGIDKKEDYSYISC